MAEATRVTSESDTQSHLFLNGLATLLRAYRYVDGRKAVVLFSEGFFDDNLGADVENVAVAASETYAVIYAVDVSAAESGVRPGTVGALEDHTARRSPLARLTTDTCGRVLSGVPSFEQQLGAIVGEAYDYYLIGFEPAAQAKPLGYRHVTVRVTRPGATALARTGYAAPSQPNPATRRRTIDSALTAPYPRTDLPLEYTTYERRGGGATPTLILSLTAHLPPDGDPNQAADVIFVVRDADSGANVASGTGRVPLPPAAVVRPGELVPVLYHVQFDIPPGDYVMRVLVRDPSGLVGTGDRRVHVRPLAGPGLTTSDLMLAGTDAKSLRPPTRAALRAEEGLLAYLELYGEPSQLASVATHVEVGPLSGGVRTAVTAALSEPAAGQRVLRARLPIESFTPGQYEARVRIVDDKGVVSVVRRVFEVVAR